jgi:hypothetical protein
VAYGSTGTLLVSTNLSTWSNITTVTVQQLKGAAFGNDTFVVVGRGGVVFQSDYLTNTPVTLLLQPTNTTALVGGSAAFRVAAGGRAPFSYQWFRDGAPIPGANSATLTLTGLTTADAGSYHAVINGDSTSATSAAATLTVVNASVGVTPEMLFRFVGTTGAFTAVVSGGVPVSYQWRNNSTLIPGATNATLSFTNIQLSNALGFYHVTAIFPFGQTDSTNSGSLQVYSSLEELFPNYDNTYQALPNGVTASIASYGIPPALSYQWFKGTSVVAGATGAILSVTNAQVSDSGDYTYVANYTSGSVTSSFPSTLVIYLAQPAVFQSLTPAANGNFNLSFTGLTGRYYQVEYTTNLVAPVTWQYFDSVLLNANPTTYLINPSSLGPVDKAFFRLLILPP